MLVKQEQLNPCEVELHIEIDAEKVNAAIDKAYKDFAKVTNIPGFRKGKAPRAILERHLDQEKVKDHAADDLLQEAYSEALKESNLDPFAPADVDIVKYEIGEPLVFTAKVPLTPTVELGEYVGLEVERKVPEVTEEQVDAEIQKILERHAEYPEVTERAIQEGDMAVVEMKNDTKPEEEFSRNVAHVGDNLPDFDKGLIGMQTGDEKVIEITYPEDYQAEELRGQTVPLRTKVVEIREQKLPELSDEWVKQAFVGELEEGKEPDPDAVDTVDKLKAKIRGAMEKAAQDVAEAEVRNNLVKKVVENSTVCFPEVLVREEVRDRFEELQKDMKQRQVSLDDYLSYMGITLDELRQRYEEESKQTLTTSFVLHELKEKEDIKVEDEDVNVEIQSMADERNVPVETVRAYVDSTDHMQQIRNRILHRKILDFLMHASNIKNVGQ